MQGRCQRIEHGGVIRGIARHVGNHRHQRGTVGGIERTQQACNLVAIHRAQHGSNTGPVEDGAGIGNRLVEQRQAITQAAIGGTRQQLDTGILIAELLGVQDMPHLASDLFLAEPFEVELKTAREHRHRQFLRVGGGEQKLDVCRRFFQGLEQRIERRLGQHVYLIDQVHLYPTSAGHVLRIVDQLAHVINAGIAGSIDFQQIHEAAGIDIHACAAFATRLSASAALAVQAFGKNAGDGSFADATGTGEQKRVVNTVRFQCVGKRPHHMLLPDQFSESPWPPFAGKYQIVSVAAMKA